MMMSKAELENYTFCLLEVYMFRILKMYNLKLFADPYFEKMNYKKGR